MRLSILRLAVGVLGLPLLCAATASASVFTTFTDNDATPTSTTVAAGGTFPVTVLLTSTSTASSDQVQGVDYYLRASTSLIFTIASRNTQTDGSPFGFTLASDSSVSKAAAGPGLNPKNGTDLGGSLTNVSDPNVMNQTVTVADFVLSVASNAIPGVYTVQLVGPSAGTGYTDGSGNDQAFSSTGVFTVNVTAAPEPGMAAVWLAAATGLGLRRRRGGLALNS